MGTGRQYDEKFKVQAVKLANETGVALHAKYKILHAKYKK